jgi:REP element-mobilizing transposase RayT
MPNHVHLLLSETQPSCNPSQKGQEGGPLKPAFGLSGESWLEGGPLKPVFGLSGEGWLNNSQQYTLADAIKSLKQGVSRRLIGDAEHFWQKRYYDFNIRNYPQFVEKLRYIHRNPVRAGLCERPEDWNWSSFLHYATGAEGLVEIESEWTARKRERAAGKLCPAVELPHSS